MSLPLKRVIRAHIATVALYRSLAHRDTHIHKKQCALTLLKCLERQESNVFPFLTSGFMIANAEKVQMLVYLLRRDFNSVREYISYRDIKKFMFINNP